MTPVHPNRKNPLKIALAALLFCAVAAYGYMARLHTSKGRTCRICSATFHHDTVYFYGIPVAWWDTPVGPGEGTRAYFNKYLGYPHAHEWTGGGYSRYQFGGVGCGKCSYGPYPPYQRELTRMGYQLVAASGIPDAADRRRYFESIIQTADQSHYDRVRATCHELDTGVPDEVKAGQLLPDTTL